MTHGVRGDIPQSRPGRPFAGRRPGIRPWAARPASIGGLLVVLSLALLASASAALTGSHDGSRLRPADGAVVAEAVTGGVWHGTWAAGMVSPPDTSGIGFAGRTVRMVVHLSVGGAAVRVRLANTFGLAPVTFGSVRVGRAAPGGAVEAGSNRPVAFDGSRSVTVPAGERLVSDPVDLATPAGGGLAVSLHITADHADLATWHPNARATTYVSGVGDHAAEESGASYSPSSYSWFYLDGIDVRAEAPGTRAEAAGTIVAFGDSITDGAASTLDANRRYPDRLAARLRGAGSAMSVVNTGIGGNRMLAEGIHHGQSAVDRFERDALTQTGVTHVIALVGINDIGLGPHVTAEELIAGHRELIRQAHAEGLRIYGGTLLPYQGAAYHTEQGERTRQAVNRWIRTSGAYDAVIDFDAAIRDPVEPRRMRAAYDSGDHLHPSDAGYRAMANAVDLSLFRPVLASPQPVGVG